MTVAMATRWRIEEGSGADGRKKEREGGVAGGRRGLEIQ